MARGSPARITRPIAAARTAVQRSLDATVRSCDSRSTLSSATGTQLIPATSPKCVTCADMAPAKAKENAPRKPARLVSRSARRKPNIPSPATTQVTIRFAVHAAVPGRIANSQVSGYAAPAFQPASSGAPLQLYGSYSGSCPARISRPASTRSGKFWPRSSPRRTACPSSAGTPKMTAGTTTSRATASTSLRRQDASTSLRRQDVGARLAPRAPAATRPDNRRGSVPIGILSQLDLKKAWKIPADLPATGRQLKSP